MERLIPIAIGYFLGCILTADFVARARLGKSAFEVGSRNPGMANIGSLLGAKGAALVLAGDIAKVILAVVLAGIVVRFVPGCTLAQASVPSPWFLGFPDSGSLSTLYAGVGATLGHNFPLWHRLRGGKGVTATCAAIILFHPLAGLVCCIIGLGVVLATKQLCFGAVCIPATFLVALALPVIGAPAEVLLLAAILLALMLIAHGGPCWRALHGEEPETNLIKKQ